MSATAAEVFPVGELLADELDARGWSQAEFAEILDRPAQFVSEIIAGKKEITRESAAQIGAAFGTSTELWLNLQDAYYLWRQGQDDRTQSELRDVRLRARLSELAPVSVMAKRGLLTATTPQGQAEELKRLFDLADIDEDPPFAVAARRSNPEQLASPTQLAWAACVRREARGGSVRPFSRDGLVDLATGLSKRLSDPAALRDAPVWFSEVGVRLIYVEAFPSSKIDGCSMLLDDKTPVIGLSGRGKRLDKVLFTILHEIAHVVLRHLDGQPLILDEEVGGEDGDQEEEANEAAATWMLPRGTGPLPERVTEDWVQRLAGQEGVHPIVIIGKLQYDGRLNWRSVLAKGAPSVSQYMAAW
jgi:HTH-type transcriptional regulator/antitoxin HigA